MKRLPRSYSREKRKEQIMGQFAAWNRNGDEELKTMNRIAKALDMTPQKHVTDMLLELVAEGKLAFVEREKSGRWTARGYYPVIKVLVTEKFLRRRITVQKRGVAVGQLEMFS
jgi:hypothetical protein